MTWERPKNSARRYYTRTFSRDGKTVREYLGAESDPIVRVLADGDELHSAESTEAVSEVRSEQASYRELEPALEDLVEALKGVQETNCLAYGFRRRKGKLQAVKFRNSKPKVNDNTNDGEPISRELFDHLAHKANRGNCEAAQRLRDLLQSHPEIWQEVGDLTRHVEEALIDLIASDNVLLEESVRKEAYQLRQSLLAESRDPTLELLLIRHIVVCWLDCEFTRMASLQPQQYKQDGRGGAKFYPYICRTSARKSSLQPAISLFPLRLSLIGCCLRRLIATLLSQERLFAKVRSRTRLASSPNSTSNCQ